MTVRQLLIVGETLLVAGVALVLAGGDRGALFALAVLLTGLLVVRRINPHRSSYQPVQRSRLDRIARPAQPPRLALPSRRRARSRQAELEAELAKKDRQLEQLRTTFAAEQAHAEKRHAELERKLAEAEASLPRERSRPKEQTAALATLTRLVRAHSDRLAQIETVVACRSEPAD
jgi:hypothetical protein